MTTQFTPGPWQWFTKSNGGPYLATPDRGRLYVMSFTRLGMQGATVRFSRWDGMNDGTKRQRMGGIMEDGLLLKDGELHPDARLIEAAPDLLGALVDYMAAVDLMNAAMQDGVNVHGAIGGLIGASDNARAAIAKATGATA